MTKHEILLSTLIKFKNCRAEVNLVFPVMKCEVISKVGVKMTHSKKP